MEKEERREQLLEAARRVFGDKGYYAAKVGDIAKAAGVAKGTVYLYFADKRSIFEELIDALFLRLSAAILRVDVEADVVAQVKHNIRAILSVIVDDPNTMRMLFAHANGLDAAFSAKIDSFYRGLKTMLADSLRDGQASGLVRLGDVELYASFTLGALKEILMETAAQAGSLRTREQIVEAVFTLLCAGYLRTPSPASTAAISPGSKSSSTPGNRSRAPDRSAAAATPSSAAKAPDSPANAEGLAQATANRVAPSARSRKAASGRAATSRRTRTGQESIAQRAADAAPARKPT